MHTPLRSCVACRKKAPKESFLRITRTKKGELVLHAQKNDKSIKNFQPHGNKDIANKKKLAKNEGRSMYLCPNFTCIERAFHRKGKNALAHHLKILTKRNIENELKGLVGSEIYGAPKNQHSPV